jgi:hypothetical protein
MADTEMKPLGRARDDRRSMEQELKEAGERGAERLGPGYMSKEEKDIIQKMMKDDEMKMKPKGYKKGGMVTRGQGCVSRKKSCKMC